VCWSGYPVAPAQARSSRNPNSECCPLAHCITSSTRHIVLAFLTALASRAAIFFTLELAATVGSRRLPLTAAAKVSSHLNAQEIHRVKTGKE
jgi:hypothetical protein